MSQQQSDLTTSCNGCLFAKYEDNMQIGCWTHEMDPTEYFYKAESGKEFRVYRRQCQFKRGEDWTRASGLSMEECVELVYDEVEIQYNVFIETGSDKKAFLKTLHSIDDQSLPAQKIIAIGKEREPDFYYDVADADLKTKWAYHSFTELPTDWRDQAILLFKSQFYVFVKPPFTLDQNFFRTLNDRIHFDKLRFGCIEGENILIMPNGLYTLRVKPLREILQEIESLGISRLHYEDIDSAIAG